MRVVATPAELRNYLEPALSQEMSVGLVPTMGALHEGHLTLCRLANEQNHLTAVSIFVNPLQFRPGEDYHNYPRNLEADCARLQEVGVSMVFAPDPGVMYPPGFQTHVLVEHLSASLEGAIRPGHFQGVATVVMKLFMLARPTRAYFGEKDFQQLQIIRRMVKDLDVPVEIVPVSIVREPDGLAMSSRNAYLSPPERAAAPAIYAALQAACQAARSGEADAGRLIGMVQDRLAAQPLLAPDYVQIVDPETLTPAARLAGECRMLAAVRVGSTRLIDNVMISAGLTPLADHPAG